MPQALAFAVLGGYRYTGSSGLPTRNRFHGCVEAELNNQDRSVAEVGSIEGLVQLVEVNETPQRQKTCIVNNHIDMED